MKISDLQSAKDMKNRKYLEEQFQEACNIIQAGGIVRVEQELSDARVETIRVIDNLDDLSKFAQKYLH